jgi:hypothetical protein
MNTNKSPTKQTGRLSSSKESELTKLNVGIGAEGYTPKARKYLISLITKHTLRIEWSKEW